MKTINVAFCADKKFEVPLHAAMFSLLESCNRGNFYRIYLVQRGLDADCILRLKNTLKPFSKYHELIVKDFDDNQIGQLDKLFGSNLIYGRIMLPEILDEDRVVYLDADVIVQFDISKLYETDFDEPVAAVSFHSAEKALDYAFLKKFGVQMNDPHFNSGVLVLDIGKWRQLGITEKCMKFAMENAGFLPSHDQSIINAVLHGDIHELGKDMNIPLYPDLVPERSPIHAGIFHFVGSPKPWDLFGKNLHASQRLFFDTISKTSINSFSVLDRITLENIARTMRISGSILRCVWRKIF